MRSFHSTWCVNYNGVGTLYIGHLVMMIIVLIQCVQVIHTPQVIQHITSNIDNT
ncbi:hypothetical protein Syun_011820 [Stephania yunnanensis]|uniref:Uncharacterized protein n=1 Tax=Stephania yunnanensis TaxID=152371 RepID=A0AAP0PIG2_9MAGN